jgi:hypothetical protein
VWVEGQRLLGIFGKESIYELSEFLVISRKQLSCHADFSFHAFLMYKGEGSTLVA